MSDNDVFLIYQLKQGSEMRDFRFEPLERIKDAGMDVARGRYNHIYTGPLFPGEEPAEITLDALWVKFNKNHPEDFMDHFLFMSDIVLLRCDEKVAAYYVDRFGFAEVPGGSDGDATKGTKRQLRANVARSYRVWGWPQQADFLCFGHRAKYKKFTFVATDALLAV